MNLNQKYEFAFDGYMFEKYPNHRTIYMDVTNKPTNYDRCIRVEKRSKNYLSIMLFSKHEVTNVNLKEEPARYQVQLTKKTSFSQPHRNSSTPYGLCQFINCCLPQNSEVE